ncbi:uncharacterized protein [Ptychodera flava]|uniref:uncharacterized protein n=1 Tax=Ptychodera flava TaxID=63121 RepID=UPI00396A15C8
MFCLDEPRATFYGRLTAASSKALFLLTSWKKNSYGPATWQLISDFCEETLKKKPDELSAMYCTVLDVEVSEEQKEDATRHGVTLILATRSKWLDPDEDPPGIHWLIHHNTYYPQLGKLKDVGHVIGLSAKTKNAASTIHGNLFPHAELHHVSPKPAALFVSNAWNNDELGLTGFHRSLVQDFCERKAKAGEDLRAYSTVLDVKISDDQKTDAESCGVVLIPARRKTFVGPKDDPLRLEWLLSHEIYYPDLKELEDVQYVVGYAPKTGHAAADIRAELFPKAKLVLINHACPESACLEAEEYGLVEFAEKMLQMASKADLLFSIGPVIYEYFDNAYRAEFQGKDLSEIPHEEIPPLSLPCFRGKDPVLRKTTRHSILTCGQVDTQKALRRCETMAVSIGTAANRLSGSSAHINFPLWKIQGVSQQADQTTVKFLSNKMKCHKINPTVHPGHSAKSLHISLQQSHLCLPAPCYMDYSFYGIEAVVCGLPTAVYKHTHLAQFILTHSKLHAECFIVEATKNNLSDTIFKHLQNTQFAFKKAKELKENLVQNEDIQRSFARFASFLTAPIKQLTGANNQDSLPVCIGLDDTEYHRCLRELEKQVQALPAQLKKEKEEMMNNLKAAWRNCNLVSKRRIQDVLGDKNDSFEINKVCKRKLGDVDPSSMTAKSLAILLRFLTLYNLYRLKQTCRSESLARAFEPLLITDEMREIAAKVGIKLHLKAMYKEERFREVELFFINRDGGGIQPLTTNDNVLAADSVEETQLSSQDEETCHNEGKLSDVSLEDIQQKVDEQLIKQDTQTSPITTVRLSSQTRSSVPPKKLEQQLTDSDIRSLPLAESKIQSLQSKLDIALKEKSKFQTAFTEKIILETQLAESLNEKSQLEKQCQEYKQQYQIAENKFTSKLSEFHTIEKRVEKLSKLVFELWTKLIQISDEQIDSELQKRVAETLQFGEKFDTFEMEPKELSEMASDYKNTKSAINKFEKEETPSDHEMISNKRSEMETATPTQPEMTGREGSEMETATPTQHEMTVREGSEMETATPTQPEMTVREESETETVTPTQPEEGSEMETATPTQPEMTGREGSEMETAQVGLETKHKKEKKRAGGIFSKLFQRFSGSKAKPGGTSLTPVGTEKQSSSVAAGSEELSSGSVFSKDIPSGTETTRSQRASGTWSRRTLKGQMGQMFNDPTGMAFHNDKLLVCDYDNNVVQILNQDYTCEKKLGSFSGQFAKPFKPLSIVVSQDNLYFILDKNNLQIVVCDEDNKIIKQITLPSYSDPYCIALVQSFVIVTDDKGHCVLKYSQDGHYVSQLGGHQGNSHSEFNHPFFVSVNSRDVIMVSDCDNHCIKCFDSDFNYKYQYGEEGHGDSQLYFPSSIAVDGADNVYVCEYGNDRISIWSRDGTWIGHLEVIEPLYMAVTADGDRIAVRGYGSNEIVVFSK